MPTVNPEILRWARESAGLTSEQAVAKINLASARGVSAVDRLAALEVGDDVPSRPMLVRMAKQYRRPLLIFYMTAPPRRGDRGHDFRTLPEGHSPTSQALLDALLRDMSARQGMVRAVLEDEEEAVVLPFIDSKKTSDGIASVSASICNTLSVELHEFRGQATAEEGFKLLRRKAEQAGVFVVLMGDLGSYRTAIDVETFRGFAIADTVAPFVVINDQDSKAAWSFTLFHELAHLWLGESGVSGDRVELAIEKFCNDVASEFLLPSRDLEELDVDRATDTQTLELRIARFARERNLSGSMIAYRLYRARRIRRNTWFSVRDSLRKTWLAQRARYRQRSRSQEGGPNFYVVRAHRVGRALLDLVARTVAGGALSTSRAGKLLGVKARQVQRLLEAAGRRPAHGPD